MTLPESVDDNPCNERVRRIGQPAGQSRTAPGASRVRGTNHSVLRPGRRQDRQITGRDRIEWFVIIAPRKKIRRRWLDCVFAGDHAGNLDRWLRPALVLIS